ncbi:MAG: hypothetical protein ACK53W_16895 [Gemmatimonadota bacterium]
MPRLLLLELLDQRDLQKALGNCGPSTGEVTRSLAVGRVEAIRPKLALEAYDASYDWATVRTNPWPLLAELCTKLALAAPPDSAGGALAHLRDGLAAAGELPTLLGWMGKSTRFSNVCEPRVSGVKLWGPAMPLQEDPPRTRARKLAVMLLTLACHVPPLVLWRRDPDPTRWLRSDVYYLRVVHGGAPRETTGRAHDD